MTKLFLTIISVVNFAASADTLAQYRKTILASAQTSPENALSRLEEVRAELLLGHHASLPPELTASSGPVVRHRLYSSLILKDILQSSVGEVERASESGKKIAFDPSWTPEEHHRALALEGRRICVGAIMNSRKYAAAPNINGMEATLADIQNLILVTGAADSDRAGNNDVQAKELFSGYLNGGPRNAQGRSLTERLGPVIAVERVDQLVHRVFFRTDAGEVFSLSLSTLLTFAGEGDEVFLNTQNCLLAYLKDQRDVFSKAQIGKVKDEDITQLNFFAEGKNLRRPTSEARAFLARRLALAEKIIPLLTSRSKLAHVTHARLKSLGPEQIKFLLDAFLRMRGADLPTADESANMGERFAEAAGKDLGTAVRVNADFMYYRVIGRQLTDLTQAVKRRREIEDAKMRDLQNIRAR